MATLAIPLYDIEKTESPSIVCVTGATGFLAAVVIERLLAGGHTVHATVRDASRSDGYAHLLKFPGGQDRLKFFSANLLEPGSFDLAVEGCDYVVHTASPFVVNVKPGTEKETVLEPAVKGVEHVLAAVNKTPTVKRVVLTSSCAAIYGDAEERGKDHKFSEEDWNTSSTETLNSYSYSKKMAEQKAWEISKQQDRWQLVTVNPSLIYGPPAAERKSSESVALMTKLVGGAMWPAAPPTGFGWVDLRDVAAAHCLAMLHPQAEGRYICCEGSYTLLEQAATINQAFPGKYRLPYLEAPLWLVLMVAPILGYDSRMLKANFKKTPRFSNTKIQEELGLKFTPRETTVRDMVHAMAALGLVKKP